MEISYTQGARSFIKELEAGGLNVTTKCTDKAKAALVAFNAEITGKKLRTTGIYLIREGETKCWNKF